MSNDGWYYLHENGSLIFKRFYPGDDGSDLVKRIWSLDTKDRENAWTILLQALEAGAKVERIRDLATKWKCDLRDLTVAIVHIKPTPENWKGLNLFLKHVGGVDPEKWLDWLAATPKGNEPDFSTMPQNTQES